MDGGMGRQGTTPGVMAVVGENRLLGEIGVGEMLPEKDEEAEL